MSFRALRFHETVESVRKLLTYVSSTQLTASVPASDLAQSGTAQITGTNLAPGGETSSSPSWQRFLNLPLQFRR
jgi:hypothetical protein